MVISLRRQNNMRCPKLLKDMHITRFLLNGGHGAQGKHMINIKIIIGVREVCKLILELLKWGT